MLSALTRFYRYAISFFISAYFGLQFGNAVVATNRYLGLSRFTADEAIWSSVIVLTLVMVYTLLTTIIVKLSWMARITTMAGMGWTLSWQLPPYAVTTFLCGAFICGFLGTKYEKPLARFIEVPLRAWRRNSFVGKFVWFGYQALVFLLLAVGFLAPAQAARYMELRSDTIAFLKRDQQDLGLLTLDGEPFDLTPYRGKTVVLHVWANWCAPCVLTMPMWNQMHERLSEREDIVLLGVSMARSAEVHQRACDELGVTWPQAMLNRDSGKSDGLPISVVPVNWILDGEGRVVRGNLMHGPALRYIEDLLAEG